MYVSYIECNISQHADDAWFMFVYNKKKFKTLMRFKFSSHLSNIKEKSLDASSLTTTKGERKTAESILVEKFKVTGN